MINQIKNNIFLIIYTSIFVFLVGCSNNNDFMEHNFIFDESPRLEKDFKSYKIKNSDKIKVGIMDSDFVSEKFSDEIKRLFDNRMQVIRAHEEGSESIHGLHVAELVAGKQYGIISNLNLVAKSVGIKSDDGKRSLVNYSWYDIEKFLSRKDINIYNFSLGSTDEVKKISSNILFVSEKKSKIKNLLLPHLKDNVLVWAAGNRKDKGKEMKDVTVEAGLPLNIPELEKGWISVVGIDPETRKHYLGEDKLAPAKSAKNWSISASGDPLFERWLNYGSSFAAPRVTAGLILVKDKFMWMDANNLRQTILTTAIDIGDIGVDDQYGWGYLDVVRALRGPAMFDNRLTKLTDSQGMFIANLPKDVESTFENDISGDGGLFKTGEGKLILAGISTFTGATNVEKGILEIQRDMTSVITNKSKLILKTGVNIKNKLILTDSSILYIEPNEVGKTSVFLKDIDIRGKLGVTLSKYLTDIEKEYIIIDIKGNSVGSFAANLETIGAISGTHSREGNLIKASLKRDDIGTYMSTFSEATQSNLNVANNVEQAFKKLDKAVESGDKTGVSEEFLNTAVELQSMSKASLLDATKKLSGEIYASSQALSYTQSQAINRALTDRLNEISFDNFNKFGNNVWISGIGTRGKVQEVGYATGKTNMFGTQVGIDKALNRDIILGLSINQSKLNTKFEKFAGKSTGNSLGISAYGRMEFGKSEISKKTSQKINNESRSFIQGRIGANFITPEVERTVLTKTSTIKRKDVVNSLYGEIGHDFKNSSLTLTPYLGAGYTSINRGSFKEEAKNKESIPWSLESESKKYSQTSLNVGLRAKYEIKSITGLKTDINANINYVKNLGDNNLDFKAKYIGLSTEEIEVKGINLPKSSTWIGIGLNTEASENLGLQVNYNAKIEKGSFADNVVSTGINYRF